VFFQILTGQSDPSCHCIEYLHGIHDELWTYSKLGELIAKTLVDVILPPAPLKGHAPKINWESWDVRKIADPSCIRALEQASSFLWSHFARPSLISPSPNFESLNIFLDEKLFGNRLSDGLITLWSDVQSVIFLLLTTVTILLTLSGLCSGAERSFGNLKKSVPVTVL